MDKGLGTSVMYRYRSSGPALNTYLITAHAWAIHVKSVNLSLLAGLLEQIEAHSPRLALFVRK